MVERFLSPVGHAVAKPFVETGRSIRQVGSDILKGGRSKRHREQNGLEKESSLRDLARATHVEMLLLLATIGFSIPMVIEIANEVIADVSASASLSGDVNWLAAITAGASGAVIGGIVNIEHSRRVGREWRLDEVEFEQLHQTTLRRKSAQTPQSLINMSQPRDYSQEEQQTLS